MSDSQEEKVRFYVFGSVLQGSVLGQLLRLIDYNRVLRLQQPEEVELTAYADDHGIMVRS